MESGSYYSKRKINKLKIESRTSTQHLTSKLPIFVPIDKLIERILNIHTKIIIL